MEHSEFISVDLESYLIEDSLIAEIPGEIASKYEFMPVFKIGDTLTIATSEPDNPDLMDTIGKELGLKIDPLFANKDAIMASISDHYGVLGAIDSLIDNIEETDNISLQDTSFADSIDLSDTENMESAIVQIVNLIVNQAYIKNASDIHIEPTERDVLVRIRVDGELSELIRLPKNVSAPITSRIKVLAAMDIAETRVPQDGHIKADVKGEQIELRISSLPTVFGENVVIRLLGKNKSLIKLSQLGFLDDDLDRFSRLLSLSQGMILVTGPTGSGKTSTLYAALNEVNRDNVNIVTLEDPVENSLPLIRQVQINPKAGLEFANGLRSILRQDPDIIMVGEIRDLETAELSVRAAQTGHFVLSTLHTNDAPSSIIRLIDMGIPPFLVASSVTALMAQRLVRKICQKCKQPYTPDERILELMGLDPSDTYMKGKGCKACQHTGYRDRLPIFELLIIDDDIRRMMTQSFTGPDLRQRAIDSGMTSLVDDGITKIRKELTTPEEVYKTTQFLLGT